MQRRCSLHSLTCVVNSLNSCIIELSWILKTKQKTCKLFHNIAVYSKLKEIKDFSGWIERILKLFFSSLFPSAQILFFFVLDWSAYHHPSRIITLGDVWNCNGGNWFSIKLMAHKSSVEVNLYAVLKHRQPTQQCCELLNNYELNVTLFWIFWWIFKVIMILMVFQLVG